MGFLDSYFALTAMADEMSEKSDVAGSFASMQSKLDGLNASMEAQVAQAGAASDPRTQANRVDATATVTGVRASGAQVNGATVVELDLLVMLAAGIPLPVTHSTLVPPFSIGRAQVGSRLAVSLDPAKPASLVVDWNRAA